MSDLSPEKSEKLQAQHASGLKANLMLKAYGTLHADREKQIIDELISWFVSNDWDQLTAIRYIAKLSENRSQHDELAYRARKGIAARSTLFGGAKTTAE